MLLVAFDPLQLGSDRDRGARAQLLPVQNLRDNRAGSGMGEKPGHGALARRESLGWKREVKSCSKPPTPLSAWTQNWAMKAVKAAKKKIPNKAVVVPLPAQPQPAKV